MTYRLTIFLDLWWEHVSDTPLAPSVVSFSWYFPLCLLKPVIVLVCFPQMMHFLFVWQLLVLLNLPVNTFSPRGHCTLYSTLNYILYCYTVLYTVLYTGLQVISNLLGVLLWHVIFQVLWNFSTHVTRLHVCLLVDTNQFQGTKLVTVWSIG